MYVGRVLPLNLIYVLEHNKERQRDENTQQWDREILLTVRTVAVDHIEGWSGIRYSEWVELNCIASSARWNRWRANVYQHQGVIGMGLKSGRSDRKRRKLQWIAEREWVTSTLGRSVDIGGGVKTVEPHWENTSIWRRHCADHNTRALKKEDQSYWRLTLILEVLPVKLNDTVALMVSVTCRDLLVVQFESLSEMVHAFGGLYTISGSLPRTGVADGMRPVVAEGSPRAVVPRASIQCTILSLCRARQDVPIAAREEISNTNRLNKYIVDVRQQNPLIPSTSSHLSEIIRTRISIIMRYITNDQRYGVQRYGSVHGWRPNPEMTGSFPVVQMGIPRRKLHEVLV